MAENNLNTRIQLLYDTYTNWSTKNPKLKKGEMVQVEVPAAVGDVTQVPSILIKTGDGEHNFNDLPWTSGLAADVYDWAKAKEAPKSAWYVTVTQTSSDEVSTTADKTPQEVLAAYQAGYAVYARANFVGQTYPYILSLIAAQGSTSGDDDIFLIFSTIGQQNKNTPAATVIATYMSGVWNVWVTNLAKTTDIPDAYILPFASPEQLGGVKPVAKTDVMTQKVGVDANGYLYTEPGAWYVTVNSAADPITADKTPEAIYAAYKAGYSVYATLKLAGDRESGAAIPLQTAQKVQDDGTTAYFLLFGFCIQESAAGAVLLEQLGYLGSGWQVWETTLVKMDDVPPTLPNPNALTIKVGDTTTTYDGSAAKTVEVPTKTSELTNDNNFITSSYVDTKVASLVDSAPETLDTLKELSAALGDDPNFATTISNQIGNKADKAQVLNITLAPASWTTSGNEFKYTYSNTSLRALVSPIITCTSNTSEYKYITDAEATANTGITFTAKTKPTNNIVLQIIDLG